MPVILSQLFSPADRVYEDAEFSLYHYPRIYFSRVRRYEPFIYYRPLGESRRREDSRCYFGHGVLGEWYEDFRTPGHRFVNILRGQRFPRLVPLRNERGDYYETETTHGPQFQAAVRDISPLAYHRILSVAGVTQNDLDTMPDTDAIAASPYPLPLVAAPTDTMREITEIPPGAGYVPRGDTSLLNIYESAALQERARRDHQETLRIVQRSVQRLGGATFYNNNIDLLARIGEYRFLIEAKSITSQSVVVDRMRYGIGQLADYAYRYEPLIGAAQRVLAFASPPQRETAWVSAILENERIALIATHGDRVMPLNAIAEHLPFVEGASH
ncbi:MAG: hypothetical protein NVS4B13_00580 [Candidatus Elarobacter sp.]